MLNIIWGGMIIISLLVSVFTGRIEQTAAAAVTGAASAVETCFALLGIMCLWTGLTKIGEKAGLVSFMSRLLRPLLKILFPKIDPSSKAGGSIVMNIVANLFGMGNAATPLGIKAMGELSKRGRGRTATNEMCMLVVLNTASIQLVPTTLISLRQTYGSISPGEIIVPVWIVSICALIMGITAAKLMEGRRKE
ncbi:MAG: nucleoside recognition protein [Clostridia bacterium]|nr:nucleoside recognition protein [Clostridia bacterium]